MELGKPSAWSLSAWVALVAICGYLIYVATHKEDTTSNYDKGSTHIEVTENSYPLAFPRCGRLFDIEKPVKENK